MYIELRPLFALNFDNSPLPFFLAWTPEEYSKSSLEILFHDSAVLPGMCFLEAEFEVAELLNMNGLTNSAAAGSVDRWRGRTTVPAEDLARANGEENR